MPKMTIVISSDSMADDSPTHVEMTFEGDPADTRTFPPQISDHPDGVADAAIHVAQYLLDMPSLRGRALLVDLKGAEVQFVPMSGLLDTLFGERPIPPTTDKKPEQN